MPAIRKNPNKITNKNICLRIYADDISLFPSEYWKDLANLFKCLIKNKLQDECDAILSQYPLASKVIEVL